MTLIKYRLCITWHSLLSSSCFTFGHQNQSANGQITARYAIVGNTTSVLKCQLTLESHCISISTAIML